MAINTWSTLCKNHTQTVACNGTHYQLWKSATFKSYMMNCPCQPSLKYQDLPVIYYACPHIYWKLLLEGEKKLLAQCCRSHWQNSVPQAVGTKQRKQLVMQDVINEQTDNCNCDALWFGPRMLTPLPMTALFQHRSGMFHVFLVLLLKKWMSFLP